MAFYAHSPLRSAASLRPRADSTASGTVLRHLGKNQSQNPPGCAAGLRTPVALSGAILSLVETATLRAG